MFLHFRRILRYSLSGKNKDQKLVGHFLENPTFCRLLIAVPKMYSKHGRPKWILVGQFNGEIGRKMANGHAAAISSTAVYRATAAC